ncbi:MAG: Gfo/Idh/MocA family oxidoreductase [Bacteroidota bacterium]|nr:Gfo/Idh/MocA family oxidoreductase [Bacteroidota bacterium]
MFRKELNIGIVGAGGFAAFSAKAFLKIPSIHIIAVTDINQSTAEKFAKELNADPYSEYEIFLDNKHIDLVYIATPPFLHYEQSKKALLAGKHVICEKPAALKTGEAEELSSLAKSLNLLYVVNLMQRYNPLFAMVKTIIEEKILGNFLHGFFENYASDGTLNADHWLWDEAISGGLFIEHGVHFFDMFEGWFGEGKMLSAVQLQRPNVETVIKDRVHATALYGGGIVSFYHAFDQPGILEKQELRLQFEKGEINLYEWIPVQMKLSGLLQKHHVKRLEESLENLSVVNLDEPAVADKKVKGRFKEIIFNEYVAIEYGKASDKQARYSKMVTAMMQDQWNWINDPNHKRIIDDTNAIESLRMAEQATQMAQKY